MAGSRAAKSPTADEEQVTDQGIVEARGQVRYVEFHAAPAVFGLNAEDWLSFHLQGLDASTHKQFRTRVVMRSNSVSELTIRDGDIVIVRGTRTRPDELSATFIENLTAHSRLDLSPRAKWLATLKVPVAVLSLAAVPAFILSVIALACKEYATGIRLGVPCLGVWLVFWVLSQRRL